MNIASDKLHPSLDEFKELAKRGNTIPVYRQLLADTITPVSLYHKLSESKKYAFLLESAAGGEKIASTSYLGCDPFMGIR